MNNAKKAFKLLKEIRRLAANVKELIEAETPKETIEAINKANEELQVASEPEYSPEMQAEENIPVVPPEQPINPQQ